MEMKKYFVTIDGKENEETFYPDAQCVFCEDKGAYKLSEEGIGFCENCMLDNYKNKVRVEDD